MRKYSVDEIDAMRSSLKFAASWARSGANIEEELRTHLLAGTSPDELEKHARATQERSLKARTDAIALEQKEIARCGEIRAVVRDELAKMVINIEDSECSVAYDAAQKRHNSAFRSAMIRLFG